MKTNGKFKLFFRMRALPALKAAALVCLAIGAALLVVYVLKMQLTEQKTEPGDRRFIARNMHIRVWKDGKVRWEIRARKVIISEGNNFYEIHDIYDGYLYNQKKTFRFTAKNGTYESTRKNVELTGNAVFRATKGGDYFRADKATWRGEIERLEMEGNVNATNDGNVIKAKTLTATGDQLEDFTLTGDVSVYIPDVRKTKSLGPEMKDSELKPRDLKRIKPHAERVEYSSTNKNIRLMSLDLTSQMAAYRQQQPQMLQPPGAQPQPAQPGRPLARGMDAPPVVEQFPGAPAGSALPPLPGLPQNAPPINVPPLPPHADSPVTGLESALLPRTAEPQTLPPPASLTPPPLLNPNAMTLKNPVTLNSPGLSMASRELFVEYKIAKYARAVGSVKIIRSGRKPEKTSREIVQAIQKRSTTILSDEAEYYWKEGRLLAIGFVSMKQKDMDVTAASVEMNTKKDTAQLRGGVTLHQKKGDWLIKEKVVDKDASDDTKDAAREETTIYCNALDIDFNNDNISASGNISVMQKDRTLTASTVDYDGGKRIWRVLGDVQINNKGDLFSGPLVEYNERTKEYIASTGGRAQMKPKDDERKELEEFFSDRDENFKPGDMKKEKASIIADKLHFNEKKNTLYAKGNAEMDFKDVSLKAPYIIVRYDDKKSRGEGGVKIKDKYTTITGDWYEADWGSHRFEVGGNVVVSYAGRPKTEKKDKVEPFELKCDKLDYGSEKRNGTATGNPILTASGRRVAAEKLTFNLQDNIFVFEGKVKMHQDNGDWLRDKDYIDADDKQAWYLAEKPTDVSCDYARFEDDQDFIRLRGSVKVSQKEKDFRADELEFFGKEKRLLLDGDVFMEQSNGEWLFEGGFIDDDEDEDVKKRVRDRVEITADKVESIYGERRMYFSGDVLVRQGASEASGRTVWYYGREKLTVMEGDVRFRDEDGRDLTAARIVHDGKKKELEAFKSVRGSGYAEKKKETAKK